MTSAARAKLAKSLAKYGDLSGFVYNRRSKTLISGHQKQKSIPPESEVVIEHKYKEPTQALTVADGYVVVNGEKFKYREVDADPVWEMEAIIAANKHSGEWDKDLLRLALADIPEIDIEMAGFELQELEAMEINLPKLSPIQTATHAPADVGQNDGDESDDGYDDDSSHEHGSDDEADAEYIRNQEQTTEQCPTENIPSMVNNSLDAFNSVEEKTQSKLQKHLVIIECPSEDIKHSIKEKLRADQFDEKHGVKIF